MSHKGLVFAMLDEIKNKMNFSYVIDVPSDNSFGIKEGGSFNGVIGTFSSTLADVIWLKGSKTQPSVV